MPIEIKRDRSEGSDQSVVVGTIDWSVDGWDYKTKDANLAILLDEVKTQGTVIALTSVNTDEGTFDFIEEEVDALDDRFLGGLSAFLLRTNHMWLRITA